MKQFRIFRHEGRDALGVTASAGTREIFEDGDDKDEEKNENERRHDENEWKYLRSDR